MQGKSDAGSFHYYKSLCHFEFVLNGPTMNQTFNIEILRRLQDVIRRNALEMGRNNGILPHDNAPAHQPLLVSNYS